MKIERVHRSIIVPMQLEIYAIGSVQQVKKKISLKFRILFLSSSLHYWVYVCSKTEEISLLTVARLQSVKNNIFAFIRNLICFKYK